MVSDMRCLYDSALSTFPVLANKSWVISGTMTSRAHCHTLQWKQGVCSNVAKCSVCSLLKTKCRNRARCASLCQSHFSISKRLILLFWCKLRSLLWSSPSNANARVTSKLFGAWNSSSALWPLFTRHSQPARASESSKRQQNVSKSMPIVLQVITYESTVQTQKLLSP